MRRLFGGYTIVEAVLALAIGGLLLGSVSVLINGQRGEAEFTQAMRDLDSKIQTVINSINGGAFTTSNEYQCNVVGGRPELSISGSAHQEGQKDTFLGYFQRRIQFRLLDE